MPHRECGAAYHHMIGHAQLTAEAMLTLQFRDPSAEQQTRFRRYNYTQYPSCAIRIVYVWRIIQGGVCVDVLHVSQWISPCT